MLKIIVLLLFIHPEGETEKHQGVSIFEARTLQECEQMYSFIKGKFEKANPTVNLHGLCVQIEKETDMQV